MPIIKCPKCGHLILDSINTEFEFMTEGEKKNFSTQSALPKSYIGNILFIIVGLVLLIGGIATGDAYLWAGLIGGGGCLAVGIYQIVRNQKLAGNEVIEQAVYESLQRTSNSKYVELIKTVYELNGIKKNYLPYDNKASFIEQYKKFETRESYIQNMYYFNRLLDLELLNELNTIDKSKTSEFIHH